MSAVDKMKTLIHRKVFEQPLHRSFSAIGQTVTDLFILFGNVNMKWHAFGSLFKSGNNILQLDRPQRMNTKPDMSVFLIFDYLLRSFKKFEIIIHRSGNKSSL